MRWLLNERIFAFIRLYIEYEKCTRLNTNMVFSTLNQYIIRLIGCEIILAN